MRVAVYSGSFNPLHIGHLAVIRYLVETDDFDRVYLIVSPKNPLKKGISSASGSERYLAAVQAVRKHFAEDLSACKIEVDDIELTMPEPHYTIRTLDALKEREPENSFTLVMGADNLAGIQKWRESRRILCEYGIAVYPRQGYDHEAVRNELTKENPEYKIRILDAPMINISSTEIRSGIASGKDMSGFIV